jgi:hypothetical protein
MRGGRWSVQVARLVAPARMQVAKLVAPWSVQVARHVERHVNDAAKHVHGYGERHDMCSDMRTMN